MKLKKIGLTGIAIALLVGGGATNDTYAMDQQENIATNVDYQVITPLWDNISGISPYISVELVVYFYQRVIEEHQVLNIVLKL